ncbi:hypothetical protein AAGW05_10275 [Arthrobacter sp. LAPM80]|uniref:hypothetical protein n=1 Tax=Arthrobacter sp. LAPM80 TaxID=3141788 RepID=UPI00398AF49D
MSTLELFHELGEAPALDGAQQVFNRDAHVGKVQFLGVLGQLGNLFLQPMIDTMWNLLEIRAAAPAKASSLTLWH